MSCRVSLSLKSLGSYQPCCTHICDKNVIELAKENIMGICRILSDHDHPRCHHPHHPHHPQEYPPGFLPPPHHHHRCLVVFKLIYIMTNSY